MTEFTLEDTVAKAVAGDADALEKVARAIKDDIYGLAIRMLWHPADAEDATQEVLLRVVTQLSTFSGASKFRTWVYRVAVRGILNFKRGRAEGRLVSFDEFGEDLLDGLEQRAPLDLAESERKVLLREVKIACTHAMLLCLDRDHRIAYLLGEIFDVDSAEAAQCLDIGAAAYRKRLSRARQRVNSFTAAHCGIVDQRRPCSCAGRLAPALRAERINRENLLFACHPVVDAQHAEVHVVANAIGEVCDGRSLMRSNPNYSAPDKLLNSLRVLNFDSAPGGS